MRHKQSACIAHVNHCVVWSPCQTIRISLVGERKKEQNPAWCSGILIKLSRSFNRNQEKGEGPQLVQFTALITVLITRTDSCHPISFPYHSGFAKNQLNLNLRASCVSVKPNDGLYSSDLSCPLIWFDIYSYRKSMLFQLITTLIFQTLPGHYILGNHNSSGNRWVEWM